MGGQFRSQFASSEFAHHASDVTRLDGE